MQQQNEGLPSKPMGGKRFPDREPQNDRLMIHIAGIPPMMPEDVVKQAATQFGPVKDFFKVNRHFEKAYEYAPCFGFLTFEHEDSVARALDVGWMIAGDTRLTLNARRPRENRGHFPPRTNGDFRGNNLPDGPGDLPDRPPPVRGQANMHARKNSNSSQFDSKGPFHAHQRGSRIPSSTCTIYGLPENFKVQDLMERGSSFGRVINAHIFEYKDRDGRRFGTINFDSSNIAEEFHNKENGQVWNGCIVKITFEPFNVARRNNAPPFRSGNSGPQSFHRHEQRQFEGPKRFPNGNRGPRYPPNGQGRFNQRGPFQPHGNGYHPQYQPQHQQYPAEQPYYDPQMMGYHQHYPHQYPQVMNPHQMVGQPHYGSGVVSPPMPYGQQMAVHGMQGQYRSPPPYFDQTGVHPIHSSHISYPGTIEYPHRYDGYGNVLIGDSPNSKHSSASNDTAGIRKFSGETSITAPTAHSDASHMYHRPMVITHEQYRQAGYQYGDHISENVHPLNGQQIQSQAQTLEPEPSEPPSLPATVPETKDPEDPSNIFIKNIDDDVISKPEHLEEYCKKFGEIVSISLPAYSNGLIKGFGFVKFTTPEAALKAKEELNLQIVGRKRLFVSFAETSDHRHSRLAKFYDQGTQSDKSPPDPLIPKMSDKIKTPEKSKETRELKDGSPVSHNNGDATSDTPVQKSPEEQINTEQFDAPKETDAHEKDERSHTESNNAIEKAAEVELAKEPASEIIATTSREQENKTEDTKKAQVEEVSVTFNPNELHDLLEAEMNGATGKSIGRRLTPEEAMKRDPAIISVERPENAAVSNGTPTPPTVSTGTPNGTPNGLKADRLKLVLKGLQTSDFSGLNTSADPGRVVPGHCQTIVTTGRKRLSDSERKELGEGILEALRPSVKKTNGENRKEEDVPRRVVNKEGLPPLPSRSDTRNSSSSSGSRVSQEEFSEALKEKFGPKIPSTIRATEVMDAVDKYVESRNGTREPSPATKNEVSTRKDNIQTKEAEVSNIVAPAPSRKVSIRRITPAEISENKAVATDELRAPEEDVKTMKTVPEEAQSALANNDVQTVPIKTKSPVPPSTIAEEPVTVLAEAPVAVPTQEPEESAPVVTTQSTTALETEEQNTYYSETASSSRRSGPSTQQKNTYSGPLKYPRNAVGNQSAMDPNYRHGQSNHGMTSPPHSKYPRGFEHPQNMPGFHSSHNDQYYPAGPNFGPHSPSGPHPPTMICDGPCPQPQCQPAFTPFIPIPDWSHIFQPQIDAQMARMGQTQIPFFDPAMCHAQYRYSTDNNGFPPQCFGGAPPGMYPHPPQWANHGNNSSNTGPHPQGGFTYPPHNRYTPPHGHHQASSPSHVNRMEQAHQQRGFQEYNQHPQMHPHFSGPMFQDQGVNGLPPQFHGHGQYRPPPGGVPSF